MSYFGTIYTDTELPSRARAVYMYLRDRSDAEGKCWPGIKTIAADMKLSRSTVKRALADLERHGYLKKLPRYVQRKQIHHMIGIHLTPVFRFHHIIIGPGIPVAIGNQPGIYIHLCDLVNLHFTKIPGPDG